ncbi:hypothetical protein A4G26_19150 [Mycobacterium kansasii]|nr:hypothetical protein [Mycobacterium kansasii]KZS52934.1 hypothetical protein A4G26_19150 [Mycobacterium kansasii]
MTETIMGALHYINESLVAAIIAWLFIPLCVLLAVIGLLRGHVALTEQFLGFIVNLASIPLEFFLMAEWVAVIGLVDICKLVITWVLGI